ncbi:hypothetical protein J2S49_001185 [Arcanobacterium wilhelmae]|uniref:Uncharacterized protein n=1 Tax=Arcanobacterium wilhelmae TaxID=1803177 RepID=A0ABT9NBL8_9ACTO|nr:hypothetical protein [Arcanobacterium wilhelmae]MDP9801109.1 hypothetical protein [Arcanobacterium wilhelmae]WFN90463.1 hypothetical protein P8A24_00960 [Arcanobacterium wilhelmae]
MNEFPEKPTPTPEPGSQGSAFSQEKAPEFAEAAQRGAAPASAAKRHDAMIAGAVALVGSAAVVAGIFLYPMISGQNDPQAAPSAVSSTSASTPASASASAPASPQATASASAASETNNPSPSATTAETAEPFRVHGVDLDASMFASPAEAKAVSSKITAEEKAGRPVLVGTVKVQDELTANEALTGSREYNGEPNSGKFAVFYLDKPLEMGLGAVGLPKGEHDFRKLQAVGLGNTLWEEERFDKWKKYDGKRVVFSFDFHNTVWPSEAVVPVGQPSADPTMVVVLK